MKKNKKDVLIVYLIVTILTVIGLLVLFKTNLVLKPKVDDLEIPAVKTCNKGYKLHDDICISKKEIKLEKPSCIEGDILGNNCSIRRTSSTVKACNPKDIDTGRACQRTVNKKGNPDITCEEGYNYSKAHQKCLKKNSDPEINKAVCPANYLKVPKGNNTLLCYDKTKGTALEEGKTKCDGDGYLFENKCYYNPTVQEDKKECKTGYLIDNACYVEGKKNVKMSCPAGFQINRTLPNMCSKNETYKYLNKCPKGYLQSANNECILDEVVPAKIIKVCDKKQGYLEVDNECHKTDDVVYECKKGYVYFNKKCLKDA